MFFSNYGWLGLSLLSQLLLFRVCVSADEQVPLSAADTSDQSLLWGPYRPNLYFGVRPRVPNSLLAGLLWSRVDNYANVQNSMHKSTAFQRDLLIEVDFRHTCEQHEGMAGYGWEEYDIREGGRQVIHDAGNSLDLTIEYVKVPGPQGSSWGARIKGTPREDAPPIQLTTLVFYAGLEGLGSLEVMNEPDELGIEGEITLKGQTTELGEFKIDITTGPETNSPPPKNHPAWGAKPLDRTLVASQQVPPEAIWQVKNVMFGMMKTEVDALIAKYGQDNAPPPYHMFAIPNNVQTGNLHLVQKTFQGEFEFDIVFNPSSTPSSLSSETFDKHIKSVSKSFTKKFEKIFKPQPPFNHSKYTKFSAAMLSNLVGGVGYFYGDSVVDRSYAPEYDEENEGFWEETAEARTRAKISQDPAAELFTSIPSRPFFPRGFLWDEGFHLLPILEWDINLTISIVQSWFSLMDAEGWIAREQILGPEARSKVPQEFQVQYPHYANPPTLFMVLETLVERLDSETYTPSQTASIKESLRELYPLLKRQQSWFRRTQWGDIKSYDRDAFSTKEAYRWRGRTPQHILTSGLDDYPRPQPPHPGELHTDLISWMGMMTRSLRTIATLLDETDDAASFKASETAIIRNIDDLHWSSKANTYCDATIDDYEEHTHVCHKGYISIFPFMTGLIAPNSPRLKAVLDLIADPNELWTDYGIRSLSKSDEFYGTGENYWRGPIWANMNFLVAKNLYVSPPPLPAPSTS
ncbi:MAG: hypothetical protein Q9160_009149 [Pyrenula sp. 1 TL-2023]